MPHSGRSCQLNAGKGSFKCEIEWEGALTKSEQNLAHEENLLAWREEDNEQETGHDAESAKNHSLETKGLDEPAVKDRPHD